MKTQTAPAPATIPLTTSLIDLLDYLLDARQIALARLIELNNGPHNRIYDGICEAIAYTQQLMEPDEDE